MAKQQTGSIQGKLLRALVQSAATALAAAATALLFVEAASYRSTSERELATLARVVGLYSEAALESDDPAAGREALAALAATPGLEAAVIYDTAGKIFASYGVGAKDLHMGARSAGGSIVIENDILGEGQVIGHLLIRRNTADLWYVLLGRAAILAAVMLLALCSAVLAAGRLRAQIAEPLAELTRSSAAMAEGDLQTVAAVSTRDEIGELASTFNRMGENLRGLVSDIRENTHAVSGETERLAEASRALFAAAERQEQLAREATQSIEGLGTSVQQVNDTVVGVSSTAGESNHAMREIKASIKEISDRTERLFEAVDKSVSSISELTASVRQVSSSADGLAQDTDATLGLMTTLHQSVKQVEERANRSLEACTQATERAAAGEQAVRKTVSGMTRIEDSFGGLEHEVQTLAGHSQSISEVLSVMDSVVGQTNLLALNAAIISSHAGEHGRGFSVVAQEIRALADRTADSTNEIRHAVEAVVAGVQRAVTAVSAGAEHVSEGVRRSRDAGQLLGEIREGSEQASEMAREIATATHGQTRDIASVSGAMSKVKERVDQISGATQEQSRAGTQIQHSVESIRSLTEDMARSTVEQTHQTQLTSESVDQVAEDVAEIFEATKAQSEATTRILEAVEFFLRSATEGTIRAKSIHNTAEALSTRAADLESKIDRFTV